METAHDDSSTPAVGRRERQKQATRNAIASAALGLARASGLGNFTVDDVAHEADISRRTFFNYFGTIEDAVNLPVDQFLDAALQSLSERPHDEPILDAVLAAIGGDVDSEVQSILIELSNMSEQSAELERYQLQSWNSAQLRLEAGLRKRLPEDAEPLFVTALAGSLIACGNAALTQAATDLQECGEENSPGFQRRLIQSVEMLRNGFSI